MNETIADFLERLAADVRGGKDIRDTIYDLLDKIDDWEDLLEYAEPNDAERQGGTS